MLHSLLAAAFTFTASATGVGKGTTVEFLFIGSDSDRDYEAMFTLDMPIAEFSRAIEKAGLHPGQAMNPEKCRVWPVGTPVSFEPAVTKFIAVDTADGFDLGRIVYTGGLRNADGAPIAANEMPESVCSLFSLAQSLFLLEKNFSQGDVYGRFRAREELRKGDKYAFTLKWNEIDQPRHIDIHVKPGEAADLIKRLKSESQKSSIDVLVSFDAELTVAEAVQFARALDLIDSVRVKITGTREDSFFYRAFLPPVSWTDRQNRMVQPFELTVNGDVDELLYIDEDWSVEGSDPKLTPRKISYAEARTKTSTDTCFIYVSANIKLSRLYTIKLKFAGSQVHNWYVFVS